MNGAYLDNFTNFIERLFIFDKVLRSGAKGIELMLLLDNFTNANESHPLVKKVSMNGAYIEFMILNIEYHWIGRLLIFR